METQTCLHRFAVKPVVRSSFIAASTTGSPVVPAAHRLHDAPSYGLQ
jgi:hypothetical protein